MATSIFKQWDDSLISLGLGALVVVVSGILLYNFFSTTSQDLLTDISANMQQTGQNEESQVSSTMTEEANVVVVTPEAQAMLPSPSATAVVIAQVTAKPAATATQAPVAIVTSTPAPVAQVTVTPLPVAQVTSTLIPVAQATNNPAPSTVAAVSGNEYNTVRDNHTVSRGETLWALAERYYGNGFEWKQIAQANNISNARSLEVGTEIAIPRQGMISATNTETSSSEVATTNDSTVSSDANAKIGIGGGTPVVASMQTPVVHTVVRGDNLSNLTMKYCGSSVSWTKISKDNNLVNPRVIRAGTLLTFNCAQ